MNLEEFPRTVERIRQRAAREGRLLDNPSDDELRPIVEKEPGVKTTKYGNMVAQSEPTTIQGYFSARDIPFSYEQMHIIVTVKVGEALEIPMLLDTGFGFDGAILLDPAIGDKIGLEYVSEVPLGEGRGNDR